MTIDMCGLRVNLFTQVTILTTIQTSNFCCVESNSHITIYVNVLTMFKFGPNKEKEETWLRNSKSFLLVAHFSSRIHAGKRRKLVGHKEKEREQKSWSIEKENQSGPE